MHDLVTPAPFEPGPAGAGRPQTARAGHDDAAVAPVPRLPVACTRCIGLIAADVLTAKRRSVARIKLPRSTARTIRPRKSREMGPGARPHLD